jgi:hypothetical protein
VGIRGVNGSSQKNQSNQALTENAFHFKNKDMRALLQALPEVGLFVIG